MQFLKGQMVKSTTSDQVYRIISINDNIYKVEHGINGEISHGCHDDYTPLRWDDPTYSNWLTAKISYNYHHIKGSKF